MQDILQPLVEKALAGQPRFLEFYLREQSRLPGARANVELAQDCGHLLALLAPAYPREVRALLNALLCEEQSVVSNTPGEFVLMCGVLGYSACAVEMEAWRADVYALLAHYACSSTWRVREGTALGWQKLLASVAQESLPALSKLAEQGNCLQKRSCIAAISEPALLRSTTLVEAALKMQWIAIEYLRAIPTAERKREEVRVLRQALGYTLSVVTAAQPEEGFALMCEIASWNDADINWILRENLKKRRLAKFREYTSKVINLLA